MTPTPPAGSGGAPRPSSSSVRGVPRRTLALIGAGVAAIAVVVLLVTVVVGGGDDAPQSGNNISAVPAETTGDDAGAGEPTRTTAAPAIVPRDTSVVVLNGTFTTGLARGVSDKLGQAGFQMGDPADANDQTRSATIVEFAPNRRAEALAVARRIGLDATSVEAMSEPTRAVSGDAMVVVTVGADQAPQQ